MEQLFQRAENLARIHGFYKIVGYLAAHGLVHDILLLALGYHHHRHIGVGVLDAVESLKTGESGHVLVEDYEVEGLFGGEGQRVGTVVDGGDVVAFRLQEDYVGLEEVYLIVSPKYGGHLSISISN